MCQYCGCATTPGEFRVMSTDKLHVARRADTASVEVLTGLLADNDSIAEHIRRHFAQYGVLAVNLMSAPGAGKTALLEATIDALGDRYRIAVIEGDLETENDAERIRAKGVPALQITTGTACHLDAVMIHDALHAIDVSRVDVLFIENVGNLVCPATFDLGQHANVVLLSVTEGDDKPAKYPVMFRAADLVLLSKADLLPVLDDFDPANAEAHLRDLANPADVFHLSARQPETLAPWLTWLERKMEERRAARPEAPARHHHAVATE